MLDVLLTVDCEISPKRYAERGPAGLRDELDRALYGRTREGVFGIPYQLDQLDRHGLKGVFFVESLFASVAGPEALRECVALVRDRAGRADGADRHEVQLHVHPEWLSMLPAGVPERTDRTVLNLKDLPEDHQTDAIALGLANLRAAGCDPARVRAFRAGNAGADRATLRAAARNGLAFDSSYFVGFLGGACGLETPVPLCQPVLLEGLVELPIGFFRDRPGHDRPLQLCACSSAELEHALLEASRRGWRSVVLLWHSFELLKPARATAAAPPVPARLMAARFRRLCRFLAAHRDRFRTVGFLDLDPLEIAATTPTAEPPLRSNVFRTVRRMAAQAAGRLW